MFTSKDVQDRTGLSKMQVWRMVEYGIITPVENPKGRGSRRRFSDFNLAEFLIAKKLYDLRAEPAQIWLVLQALESWRGAGYPSFWHYIKSAEYKGRRQELGEEPIFLVITETDMITDPPAKAINLYREAELNRILARCHAAIVVNLLPMVNKVFF